jgi:hypothetical protein
MTATREDIENAAVASDDAIQWRKLAIQRGAMLQEAEARAEYFERLREDALVYMGERIEALMLRLKAIEEEKLRASAGPGKFVMIQDGFYGSIKLPDHLFDQLDSRHFISPCTEETKLMCANQQEKAHLKSLGVQMSGVAADWFKIERMRIYPRIKATPGQVAAQLAAIDEFDGAKRGER